MIWGNEKMCRIKLETEHAHIKLKLCNIKNIYVNATAWLQSI